MRTRIGFVKVSYVNDGWKPCWHSGVVGLGQLLGATGCTQVSDRYRTP